MKIKVGNEEHYVPDILFKDGTYKDKDDYIATMLRFKKLVTEYLDKPKRKIITKKDRISPTKIASYSFV